MSKNTTRSEAEQDLRERLKKAVRRRKARKRIPQRELCSLRFTVRLEEMCPTTQAAA